MGKRSADLCVAKANPLAVDVTGDVARRLAHVFCLINTDQVETAWADG